MTADEACTKAQRHRGASLPGRYSSGQSQTSQLAARPAAAAPSQAHRPALGLYATADAGDHRAGHQRLPAGLGAGGTRGEGAAAVPYEMHSGLPCVYNHSGNLRWAPMERGPVPTCAAASAASCTSLAPPLPPSLSREALPPTPRRLTCTTTPPRPPPACAR